MDVAFFFVVFGCLSICLAVCIYVCMYVSVGIRVDGMGWDWLVRTNRYCGYFSVFLFVCKGYREEGGGVGI